MCGLVGTASVHPNSGGSWLAIARDTLRHRGPDDAGEWWSSCNRVGLAHRRLSIRDISQQGHQPMHLLHSDLTIIFNGEIYNFRELRRELRILGHHFRSGTDTEVLLAAYKQWGTQCLEFLNGMFAFALFDSSRQRLFLARDRAGEKPLYYHLAGESLYFASELKALLANPILPRRINREALDCYLAFGYVPGELCLLDGYSKLPPAHAMTFDLHNGSVELWRYWQLPDLESSTYPISEPELLETLDGLLEAAVHRQLSADVPVGILLSGGLDSSLVTAMAVRCSNQVRTFSVGFAGHGHFDESPHARLIASFFGTEHEQLIADPTSADLLPILARQFDEPIADSSMIPTWLVSHLVRRQCSVALGGDGGDELFGGYNSYRRLLRMKRLLPPVPDRLLSLLALSAEYLLPPGFKGRSLLKAISADLVNHLPLPSSHFDATTRRRLIPTQLPHPVLAESILLSSITANSDLLQRATRFDFSTYLADDILVKVDRASMFNGLELRSPFLDHRLIEFAFAKVPSYLKATPHDTKILLKRLAARVLPPDFNMQRKQGFSIPLSSWLKAGPFRELFWDTLTSPDCIFSTPSVNSLLDGQDRGFSNSERLFALVLFELWRKSYGVSL